MSASAAGGEFGALIEAVRAGSPEALASLYREYGAALYRLAYRLTETREDALELADQAARPPADPDATVLESAVHALPDPLRIVVMLKEVEGYSHREVADLLGISVGASRVRAARALARLRKVLG